MNKTAAPQPVVLGAADITVPRTLRLDPRAMTVGFQTVLEYNLLTTSNAEECKARGQRGVFIQYPRRSYRPGMQRDAFACVDALKRSGPTFVAPSARTAAPIGLQLPAPGTVQIPGTLTTTPIAKPLTSFALPGALVLPPLDVPTDALVPPEGTVQVPDRATELTSVIREVPLPSSADAPVPPKKINPMVLIGAALLALFLLK